jgi:hypothetical protein
MNLVWMLRPLNPPQSPFFKGGARPTTLLRAGARLASSDTAQDLVAPLKKGAAPKARGDLL